MQEQRNLVLDRLSGKVSKEDANYRPQDNTYVKHMCAECEHYLTPGRTHSACRRVAGVVSAEAVCDLFVSRVAEAVPTQGGMTVQVVIN